MFRVDEIISNNFFVRLKYSNKVYNFFKYIEFINSLFEVYKIFVG